MIGVAMRWLVRSIPASIGSPSTWLGRFYTHMIFWGNLQQRVIYEKVPRPIRRVLFVCKGNICRSPLAGSYLRERLMEQRHLICVSSAGLETTPGKEAHPLARVVARRHGLSLQAHITTPLVPWMVDQADLILVMEFAQLYRLLRLYPKAKGKVFLLGSFNDGHSTEIVDPYDGTLEDFERCYQMIRRSCDKLLQRIGVAC